MQKELLELELKYGAYEIKLPDTQTKPSVADKSSRKTEAAPLSEKTDDSAVASDPVNELSPVVQNDSQERPKVIE